MRGPRVRLSVVLVVLAVAGMLVSVFWRAADTSPAATPGEPMPDLATGWRWEAYGGIEVRVPADWGYGTSHFPPCLTREKHRPYVGRPGAIPAVGCVGPPVPALALRAPYLWFHTVPGADGIQNYDGGWVSETRTIGDAKLTVFSDDPALRAAIFGSARPAAGTSDTDCPADHPARGDRDFRPDPAKPGLTPVESITVCRYSLPGHGPAMLSAGRLTGDQAAAVARAILAAPEGTGPDAPQNCTGEVAYGDELVVLRIAGGTEVLVRYSGCVAHGFDDGHARRQLTADAIRPILSGPHRPTALSGEVGQLLWGTR